MENNNMASCLLSILDTLKLFDNGSLDMSNETLSEIMFRKMNHYNIDLNKELGFDHLCPVEFKEKIKNWVKIDNDLFVLADYVSDDLVLTNICIENENYFFVKNIENGNIQLLKNNGYKINPII